MKLKLILTFILFSLLCLPACAGQLEDNAISSPIPDCPLRGSNGPLEDLKDDFVEVIFVVEATRPQDTIVIWHGENKLFECNNLLPDELTGEGHAFRKAVHIEGETFRFELRNDTSVKHEAHLVPIPIVYPENPENTLYLAAVKYSTSFGMQAWMRTEPVYYE